MESSKLQKQLEREQAEHREAGRKVQSTAGLLTDALRKEDTRRKILAGSWAIDAAEKDEEFRMRMMRDMSRAWLVRDDDRELFGLELLSEEEKQRREIRRAPGRPRKSKTDVPEASASATLSEDSASAVALITERETEAA